MWSYLSGLKVIICRNGETLNLSQTFKAILWALNNITYFCKKFPFMCLSIQLLIKWPCLCTCRYRPESVRQYRHTDYISRNDTSYLRRSLEVFWLKNTQFFCVFWRKISFLSVSLSQSMQVLRIYIYNFKIKFLSIPYRFTSVISRHGNY
jgi:hypothetical protein